MAYGPPTSAHLTDDSASSSWPGLLPTPKTTDSHHSSPADMTRHSPSLRAVTSLLRTPTSQLAVNGGSQHPDKRKAGGHGPTLADEVEFLLPTPRVQNGETRNQNIWRRPDGEPLNLENALALLPTPTAGNPNDGESPDSWEARRRRNLAKGINGNGQGTPLGMAVQLLPTPVVADARGSRQSTAPNPRATNDTLTDWLWRREGRTGAPTPQPSTDGSSQQEWAEELLFLRSAGRKGSRASRPDSSNG
jgi:hypothetical protein